MSINDFGFADVHEAFATDQLPGGPAPYQLIRTPKRELLDGVAQNFPPTTTTMISASVTPISMDPNYEQKGAYNWDGRRVITATQLTPMDETYEGDAIVINGISYYVIQVKPYPGATGFVDARAFAYRVKSQ